MLSDDHIRFIRAAVRSVWTLELLLLLRRTPDRAWSTDEIVRELRSSANAVNGGLAALRQAGVVAEMDDGRHRYQPAAPPLDAIVAGIAAAYAQQPMTVINTILSTPDAKIQSFANAFKLGKD